MVCALVATRTDATAINDKITLFITIFILYLVAICATNGEVSHTPYKFTKIN